MDSVYLAVAGIALLVVGVIGFIAAAVFLVTVTVMRIGMPYVVAVVAHAAAELRDWLTPSDPVRPVLARTPGSRR